MPIAERAVAEARLWIGTPYLHQGTCRGAGADCLGLIRGVWRALYGQEPCAVPAYTASWAEVDREERLLLAAQSLLVAKPLATAAVGDVLVFRMKAGGIAKHLGIQSAMGPHPQFIHAYSGHTVTESSLSTPWARRICGRFAFPEGAL